MQYTNHLNLPQPIVDAVVNDEYDAGKSDISVTSLISPPQKVALEKQHKDKISKDVSEEIYALMGKSIHNILEKADTSDLKEQRLYTDVNGWRVSGQFDRINVSNNCLQDYKMASVWEYIYGIKEERIQQLNCYAHLVRENMSIDIEKLEVIFIFRDWSKSKAKFDKDYPQHQIAVLEIPLWEPDHAKAFIELKVAQHQNAQDDLNMRELKCTDEERWKEPTKHALMKPGRKRAVKLYDTAEEAEEARSQDKSLEFYIETRHGTPKRCEDYCHAALFCSQYQSELSVNKVVDVFREAFEPTKGAA